MSALETVRAAIKELERRRGILAAQISVLDEGARSLERSYGNAVDPAERALVELAHAINVGAVL